MGLFIKEHTSKKHEYLYLVDQKTNADGKRGQTVLMTLGSLEKLKRAFKDPRAFFKELVSTVAGAVDVFGGSGEPPLKDSGSELRLGEFFIGSVLEALKTEEFFDGRQKSETRVVGYRISEIFNSLVTSTIIDPGSVLAMYESLDAMAPGHGLPAFQFHEALTYIGRFSEDAQVWIFNHSGERLDSGRMVVLLFDGTNFYFETEWEDGDSFNESGEVTAKGLRKRGPSKERRPNPIVGVGLLSAEDGLPVGFEVFPGNAKEYHHLTPLLTVAEEREGIEKHLIVGDRNFYTKAIIAFVAHGGGADLRSGQGYLIGKSIKKSSGQLIEWATRDRKDWKTFKYVTQSGEKDIPYDTRSEIRLDVYEDGSGKKAVEEHEEFQMVYFSQDYADRSRRKREKRLAAGKKPKPKDSDAYDGLYLLTTNVPGLTPLEIRETYAKLSVAEDNFRILKSDLALRPCCLRVPEHIVAHVSIEVTALSVLRILERLLDGRFSVPQIREGLGGFRARRLPDGTYYIPYSNEVVRELSRIFGIEFKKQRYTLKELGKLQKKASVRL